MSSVRLTAAAPLPLLVSALGRAGWGYLDQRPYQGVRALLRTLADMLPARSGEGVTTLEQIAGQMGYSVRWTSVLVHWLDDAGIVTYRRGQVWEGVPKPGSIRVHKKRLIDLIREARPINDQVQADRRARTRLRLERLGKPTLKNRNAAEKSPDRPEVTSGLPPSKGKKAARSSGAKPAHHTIKGETMPTPSGRLAFMPTHCPHAKDNPLACNRCQHDAQLELQEHERLRQVPGQSQLHGEPDGNDEGTALMLAYMRAHHPDLDQGPAFARAYLADTLAGTVAAWEEREGMALA